MLHECLLRHCTAMQVCNLLHHFLLKAFPEQYEARAEETRRETLPALFSSFLHGRWQCVDLLLLLNCILRQ